MPTENIVKLPALPPDSLIRTTPTSPQAICDYIQSFYTLYKGRLVEEIGARIMPRQFGKLVAFRPLVIAQSLLNCQKRRSDNWIAAVYQLTSRIPSISVVDIVLRCFDRACDCSELLIPQIVPCSIKGGPNVTTACHCTYLACFVNYWNRSFIFFFL